MLCCAFWEPVTARSYPSRALGRGQGDEVPFLGRITLLNPPTGEGALADEEEVV
jgi:hypothetical protein